MTFLPWQNVIFCVSFAASELECGSRSATQFCPPRIDGFCANQSKIANLCVNLDDVLQGGCHEIHKNGIQGVFPKIGSQVKFPMVRSTQDDGGEKVSVT